MKSLLVLGMLGAASASAQLNLVTNPGFEAGETPWTFEVNSAASDSDGAFSVVAAAAHTGTAGAQVVVTKAYDAANNWYLQLKLPRWTVKPATRYSISFWAKGPAATIHMGYLDVPAGYEYLGGINATMTSSWKKYTGELVTTTQSGKSVVVGLYLAGATGTYQFDDFEVLEQAPVDQSWFQDHSRRIDSLRKRDFSLSVLDSTGSPLTGAEVRLKLARHSWPFGTALALQATDAPNAVERWYRATAAELFNEGVYENDFKWPSYEKTAGNPDTVRIDRYLRWADSVGMPMRGHALVWAIQQFGFETFWATDTSKVSCSQLASNIKDRIVRDMTRYKGRMKEYDVWNEPIHEQAFFARCKDDPRFAPEGVGLMDSAFAWARATDPGAKLYVNEYNNVDGGENEPYFELLQGMVDRKVPFDAIGIQCHFGGKAVDPGLVRLRMDRLATIGKPLKVTEFDNERMDGTAAFTPEQQAVEFARFLRLAYSHPAVEGVLLWGFWDSRHWLRNAGGGIFDIVRQPKPAVDSIRNLWNVEWSTDTTRTPTNEGLVRWRGFPGKYVATVTRQGRTWTVPVDLSLAQTKTIQLSGPGITSIGQRPARSAPVRVASAPGSLSLLRADAAEALDIAILGLDGTVRARRTLAVGALEARISLTPGTYLVRTRSATGTVVESATVLR